MMNEPIEPVEPVPPKEPPKHYGMVLEPGEYKIVFFPAPKPE